jgi:hypothetical protein
MAIDEFITASPITCQKVTMLAVGFCQLCRVIEYLFGASDDPDYIKHQPFLFKCTRRNPQ